MRLAFVNSAWPPAWGGGEKWTVEAAEWFRAGGHEVLVVGRPISKLLAAARGRGIEVQEFAFGGDLNPFVVSKARRLFDAHHIEVAAVNFNKEAWQFGRAAKSLDIPVIARHGFPILRKSFLHRQLVNRVITRLVVNAQAICDEYAHLGFDVTRTLVIHNGVRTIEQRPGELRRRFEIPADVPLILAAGRIEPQKRFDRVVEIAASLLPTRPNLHVLIAGEGPDRPALELQIQSHGLAKHVEFTGFIPDWNAIIGDADLFLLTSDQEGTPNVLLEAMAAGVPSIAFAVGSVPEILTNDLSSNVIPRGDVQLMIRRIDQLLADDVARHSTGAAMRRMVQANFGLDHSMQQFADLFQQTLMARR